MTPAQPGPEPQSRPVRELLPGDVCPFCARVCHVPVSRHMPAKVVTAYDIAGLGSMATCEDGAADEQRRLGASYADVIVQRVDRARALLREAAEQLGMPKP